MKTIKQYLKEGFADNYGVGNATKIKATSTTIKGIIQKVIKECGNNCSLNHIDVSGVKNMGGLFSFKDGEVFDFSEFNGDISEWNVSKVESMSSMFRGSKFTGDISKWDVRNVERMQDMFSYSQFNGDISKWDVGKVMDMKSMFSYSQFNGDISGWDVSNVDEMREMFKDSKFSGYIGDWVLLDFCALKDILLKCPAAKNMDNVKAISKDIDEMNKDYDAYYTNSKNQFIHRIVDRGNGNTEIRKLVNKYRK